MTLSPPVRVFALVGALVLTGLGAFLLLAGRGGTAETAAPATPHIVQPSSTSSTARTPTATSPAAKQQAPAARKLELEPGLPYAVAHALRYSRVVVIAVYVPGAQVDALVRKEAQAAAKSSRAGYVGVSASSEAALQRLVAKTGVLPDPAVIVMRRPGKVVATLGVSDRETIAQAVAQARAAT
jgi:hypothetical protein